MEVGIGKGVQDPKGHAMAHHECNISFLLLFMVSAKLQIIYFKYFIPIAWGIFMGHRKVSIKDARLCPQANPLVKYIV